VVYIHSTNFTMFCFQDQYNRYLCSAEIKRMDPSFIKVTPSFINTHIPPPTFANKEYRADITQTQIAFAFFSTYVLFPLLYIIVSTGNIQPIMAFFRFIKSGIFNTVHAINEFITDVMFATLRAFGQYTFSTYTVVKNGREIYTASSLCYYMHSNVDSVYRIDRAKYNVCKWIDRQCKQYSLDNSGEEPELTDTHNDIYDFILHKVDDQPFTRIHRGDFSGRTHTLMTQHYRPFKKWNQMASNATLNVCLPAKSDSADDTTKPETFSISLKWPCDFFLEKNEILDKKFLQWKMVSEHNRADIANYIGQPFSKYSLTLRYHDSMRKYFSVPRQSKAAEALKEATSKVEAEAEAEAKPEPEANTATTTTTNEPAESVIYYINDSHSVLIGTRYVVKVDSILRCPVFESSESQVYDLDNMLASYYTCSDSDSNSDSHSHSHSDSDSEVDDGDSDSDNDGNGETENNETKTPTPTATAEVAVDPEFELIDEQTTN